MFQEFTGKEYLYIDIANNYGLDRKTWAERITWTLDNVSVLDAIVDKVDNSLLYLKSIQVLKDTWAGKATGHAMACDATSSGYQCMAALTGCHDTARMVNLIDTGKREDLYTNISDQMNSKYGTNTNRATLKKPIMTYAYGSVAQPKQVFGENTPELDAFYNILETQLPGAIELMEDLKSVQNNNKAEVRWTLPDGFKVVKKSYVAEDTRFKIPAINSSYTYRHYVNAPDPEGRNIPADVVQSVDAYIAREVIRRCYYEDIQVFTIHDSYHAACGDMNSVRFHYKEILAEIAESNLMRDIFREITGDPSLSYSKVSNTLGKEIRNSNYALS